MIGEDHAPHLAIVHTQARLPDGPSVAVQAYAVDSLGTESSRFAEVAGVSVTRPALALSAQALTQVWTGLCGHLCAADGGGLDDAHPLHPPQALSSIHSSGPLSDSAISGLALLAFNAVGSLNAEVTSTADTQAAASLRTSVLR
jgi:hypothetical protein